MTNEFMISLIFFGIALIILILQISGIIKVSNIVADIILGVAIIIGYFYLKKMLDKSTEINNEYNKFKALCDSELLIVFDDRIHGNNSKGELTLMCSEIDKVTSVQKNDIEDSSRYKHETLIIIDIVGNRYEFCSFGNVKELVLILNDVLSRKEA